MRSLTLRSVDVVEICLFIDFWPKRGFRFGRNWEFGLIVGLKWKLALLQENVWPQDHLSHRSSTNSISNPFYQLLSTFFLLCVHCHQNVLETNWFEFYQWWPTVLMKHHHVTDHVSSILLSFDLPAFCFCHNYLIKPSIFAQSISNYSFP